jgi:hypothetical protein
LHHTTPYSINQDITNRGPLFDREPKRQGPPSKFIA